MNFVYRLVWNISLNCWVAASELSRAVRKGAVLSACSGPPSRRTLARAICLALATSFSAPALALAPPVAEGAISQSDAGRITPEELVDVTNAPRPLPFGAMADPPGELVTGMEDSGDLRATQGTIAKLGGSSQLTGSQALSELARETGAMASMAATGAEAGVQASTGSAAILALPPLVVDATFSESNVERDSTTGAALTVVTGGDYTGNGVTLTSSAPSPGGNIGAAVINGGGRAKFDADSVIRMESTSPATVCCTYGILATGAGSSVETAASIFGSTGGVGAYDGATITLTGGSASGLFGAVASGAGSLITGTADFSGSDAGIGVSAELGGTVELTGGRVLSNGMQAKDAGSSITAAGVEITGPVRAVEGATINLAGGSVTYSAFGAQALSASGAGTQVTTSADISGTGSTSASSISASNGAAVNVTGGTLVGTIRIAGPGTTLNYDNAQLRPSTAIGGVGLAATDGAIVTLNSGSISESGSRNTIITVSGSGTVVRNNGTLIGGLVIGAAASNGGTYELGAGASMLDSQTGIQANSGGLINSSGTISARNRAVHSTGAASNVVISGGSLATTSFDQAQAGLMSEDGASIDVTDASVLTNASFAGNGVWASGGGTVNLAGGTLSVAGNNSSGLIVDGTSSITFSSPLTIEVGGASSSGLSMRNAALESYNGLTVVATGQDSSAVSFQGSNSILSLVNSTATTSTGPVIQGESGGSAALHLTGSTLSGPILLSDNGGLVIIDAANTALSGSASAGGSSIKLNSGSRWQLGAGASTLGSLALNSGTLGFNSNASLDVASTVELQVNDGIFNTAGFDGIIRAQEFVGSGDLIKDGAGRLTISGGMNYSGATVVNDGELKIGDGTAVGNVNLGHITTSSQLTFDRPDTVHVGQIDGAGSVSQSGTGTTIISGDNNYTGTTTVAFGTLQLGDGGSTGSVAGDVLISAEGTLALRRGSGFAFSNSLAGSGVLDVDADGGAFNFTGSVGDGFIGTVVLGASTFDLGELNTAALTNATLRLEAGNSTTVADGIQQIGGLAIDGGKLSFNASAPDQLTASSLITAGSLDASGTGTIAITVPASYSPPAPDTPNVANLLSQDDGNTGTKLVAAGTVIGSGGALTLVDENGTPISNGTLVDITQDGAVVASATYDYRLTTSPGDGLYVNYGLTQLSVMDGEQLRLEQDTGAAGAAADMSAKITGQGGLEIAAGTSVISLSNANNDYAGETSVLSGALRLEADNALGNTSLLTLDSNTQLQLNGKTQTVGSLQTASASSVDLAGGSLSIANGGTSLGTISGSGKLALLAGDLEIRGANNGLTANVLLADGAVATLNDNAGLGVGALRNDGTLLLSGTTSSTALRNSISGSGTVKLESGSEALLAGNNIDFDGAFSIDSSSKLVASEGAHLGSADVLNDGELAIANQSSFSYSGDISGSGTLTKTGAGTLSLAGSNTYSGDTSVQSGTLRAAHAGALSAGSAHVVGAAGQLDTGGFDQSIASLSNVGTTSLVGAAAGSTLTVAGDYNGSGGRLVLGTELGGDNSNTDRLVVQGNTSGSTNVRIVNVGGTGASTENGIKVIDVAGQSNGDFALEGRAVAGAFDYFLAKGGKNSPDDGDWYLRSEADGIVDPVLRPEPASYLGNQQAAQRMFRHSLHDRAGEPLLGWDEEDELVASAWARAQAGQLGSSVLGGQIDMDTLIDSMQIGTELKVQTRNAGTVHVGLMGGSGHASTNATSKINEYTSRGVVKGKAGGVYATWYPNSESGRGLYVDAWSQLARFNNRVTGEDLPQETYRSRASTSSLEAGYAMLVASGEKAGFYLEPQVQVVHTDLSGGGVRESNGTIVRRASGGGTTIRLGLRAFTRPLGHAHNRVQPFATLNWWKGGNRSSITMDDQLIRADLPRDIYEAKLGAQVELGRNWTGWGQLNLQRGSYGFRDNSAQIGAKYSW